MNKNKYPLQPTLGQTRTRMYDMGMGWRSKHSAIGIWYRELHENFIHTIRL